MYIKSLKIIKQKAFLKHFLIPSKISVHIETKSLYAKKVDTIQTKAQQRILDFMVL